MAAAQWPGFSLPCDEALVPKNHYAARAKVGCRAHQSPVTVGYQWKRAAADEHKLRGSEHDV
jgi:hypothetical protein